MISWKTEKRKVSGLKDYATASDQLDSEGVAPIHTLQLKKVAK